MRGSGKVGLFQSSITFGRWCSGKKHIQSRTAQVLSCPVGSSLRLMNSCKSLAWLIKQPPQGPMMRLVPDLRVLRYRRGTRISVNDSTSFASSTSQWRLTTDNLARLSWWLYDESMIVSLFDNHSAVFWCICITRFGMSRDIVGSHLQYWKMSSHWGKRIRNLKYQ